MNFQICSGHTTLGDIGAYKQLRPTPHALGSSPPVPSKSPPIERRQSLAVFASILASEFDTLTVQAMVRNKHFQR